MTDIEQQIVSALRWRKRRFALTVPWVAAWGLFMTAWFSLTQRESVLRAVFPVVGVAVAIFLLMFWMLARDTRQAEQALKGGDARLWLQIFLDKRISDARFGVWIFPIAGVVLAWLQWDLHAPGTERIFLVGLFVLAVFVIGATWWSVRELRQLRRQRGSL
jgi:hypothetical protein